MKKTLLTLFLVILSALIISCAGDETPAGETTAGAADTAETTAEVVEDKLPEQIDMGGFTLRILNNDPSWFSWANTVITVEEITGDALNDVIYNRTSSVEQYYNAVIEETMLNDVSGVLKSMVMSGEDTYDMVMLFNASNLTDAFVGGLLDSWDNLDNLQTDQPWWDADATALYNFNGRQVALSGDFSLYDYSTRHCYVFNKNMYADLNIDANLYQLVNDGKWTLDKLYELGALAVMDLDGNNEFSAKIDQFGISGTVTRHYSALLAGSNVKYVDRDSGGELFYAIPTSEYNVSTIQKIVELNQSNNTYNSGANDIGGGDETIFRDGRTLFTAAYINEAGKLRDMEYDIGIVPPPKLNENQDKYYSLVEGGALSVMPVTLSKDRYENVGALLDGFAFFSHRDVIPVYIDLIVKSKFTRDEESVDMLNIIFDSAIYDLGVGAWSGTFKNQYTQNIFLPRSTDVASLNEKITPAAEKALNDFNEAVRNLG